MCSINHISESDEKCKYISCGHSINTDTIQSCERIPCVLILQIPITSQPSVWSFVLLLLNVHNTTLRRSSIHFLDTLSDSAFCFLLIIGGLDIGFRNHISYLPFVAIGL